MKILFLSTTDIEGGAAIASFRLFQALKKSGLDVKMLVGQKLSDDKDVVEIWKSNIKKYISCGLHISEKLKLLMNINNRKDIFFFSTGEFGTDISKPLSSGGRCYSLSLDKSYFPFIKES
jgi:Tat protein secretion system quality control protein TatD with DNase activity